jgi:protein-arginine kinase activator protein McsA
MKLRDDTSKKGVKQAKKGNFVCDYCKNKVTDIHPIKLSPIIVKRACGNCYNTALQQLNNINKR